MNIKNAIRLLGLMTILSAASVTIPAYAATLPISDLTATPQAGGSIKLDWTYPDVDTTVIDVVRADDAGFTVNVTILDDDDAGLPLTHTDATAVNGNTYFYKIVQDNSAVESNVASATSDGTGPSITPVIISSNNANPIFAKNGDTITVTITGGEALSNVVGTIAGESATMLNTIGNTWTATLTLSGNEPEGLAAFSITAEDSLGNPTTVTATTDLSSVTIDLTAPVVTGSTTNINDGGSTVKTLADQYVESCSATDLNPLAPACTVQSGSIDTTILGLQTVIYQATDDAGNVGTDTVSTTIIAGNSPIITILGDNPQIINLHDAYTELGATASDVEDGDLTGAIVTDSSGVDVDTLGSYIVTYDVTDSSGNTDHEERTVNVVTGGIPVITILGDNSEYVLLNNAYVDAGATALDAEDGDLTGSIITSGSVDTSTLGDYIISYDVTDSNGNSAHAERTTHVVTGNGPIITLTGGSPFYVDFGMPYVEPGFTATDVEDGDITASVVVTDNIVDSSSEAIHIIKYDVTDSNENTFHIERVVSIAAKPAEGRSCGGDCYHPHFGVDQNGKEFYDDGLMIDNLTYKIDNVLHNPYSALYLNVGEPVTFKLKAMDNWSSQIRHMELALSIPKGDFDKQKADVIIDLNLSWDGVNTISYEGDKTLVKDVSSDVTKTDKIVTWTLKLTPTQKLNHDMFALSVVDQYQYVGTYYINEGIKITGISQNGVPEFDYLDSLGYNHHLTIVDQSLEDLSVAVDEQGHKWTLDSKTQFWMKEFIRPDMKCSVSNSGNSRNCVTEFNEAKLIEQAKATEKFDSSKIQKTIDDSSTIMPGGYGRLHDPVPNMMKAYIDYAKSRAGHS